LDDGDVLKLETETDETLLLFLISLDGVTEITGLPVCPGCGTNSIVTLTPYIFAIGLFNTNTEYGIMQFNTFKFTTDTVEEGSANHYLT